MTEKLLGAIILLTLGILLASCEPPGEVFESIPSTESDSAAAPVELDDTTATETAVPIEPTTSDRDLTAVPTKDLLTAVPATDETSPPDAFLIFGLGGGSKDTAGEIDNEAYEQAVVTAVTANLAERTNTVIDSVSVDSIERTEVQRADPCGTNANETSAANDGLSLGYELLLTANEVTYRYVAFGGLAYYCAQ